MSLLAELGNSQARRSKSAHKIAAYVIKDPEAVLSMSIATLAAKVGVSEPTVNRFCTGLCLKGFPDFKLTLAAELARSQPSVTRDIEWQDSSAEVAAKIFESTHACLTATANRLDAGAVEQAIDRLTEARSIVLCGLGASASVALDAQHKLLRFETPVIAHTDMINQRMTALRALFEWANERALVPHCSRNGGPNDGRRGYRSRRKGGKERGRRMC